MTWAACFSSSICSLAGCALLISTVRSVFYAEQATLCPVLCSYMSGTMHHCRAGLSYEQRYICCILVLFYIGSFFDFCCFYSHLIFIVISTWQCRADCNTWQIMALQPCILLSCIITTKMSLHVHSVPAWLNISRCKVPSGQCPVSQPPNRSLKVTFSSIKDAGGLRIM